MAKINLYLSAIDHVTKVSLADTFAVIASGGCDGIKTKTAAALADRPVRPLSTKGLKNGVYAVPAHLADEIGFAEIAVKWSWNRRAAAREEILEFAGAGQPHLQERIDARSTARSGGRISLRRRPAGSR